MGSDRGDRRWFKGIQEKNRVWHLPAVFSSQQVSNLYFQNIVPRDGLVAEYLFNEASGSTALDTAGNNHGTITGATYTLETPLKPRTAV
jgi:hypothetical protein